MVKKAMAPVYPPLGTLIDGNTLELVELIGVGGYGVVYRAEEAFAKYPKSYAVKCLFRGHMRRHLHIREISLHQIASAHPGVVTLHRVVEDFSYTYFIMEYAPNSDLFTQILHESRYLGNDTLIKHVFLQLLDAVQYCHSLGIYHRDLKPENILCFDHGYRVAITDFGLATTEKVSREFRTGSIYHMSPECQAGGSNHSDAYSPMFNDVWSLGIILLNLVTGRNPWKSATPDDATFETYRQSPRNFLPTILPISRELNDILLRALEVNWKSRMTIPELRHAVDKVTDFYSTNVIFEGNLARCPWEEGMDLGNGPPAPVKANNRPVPPAPQGVEPFCIASTSFKSICIVDDLTEESRWRDSDTEIETRTRDTTFEESNTPYTSGASSYSSDPSLPQTPSSLDTDFRRQTGGNKDTVDPNHVANCCNHVQDVSFTPTPSIDESTTDHAYTSSLVESSMSQANLSFSPVSYFTDDGEDKTMMSPSASQYSIQEISAFSDWSSSSEDSMCITDSSIGVSDIVVWPEIQTPEPSKPIDIVGSTPRNARRRISRTSIFNPPRHFLRSSGRKLPLNLDYQVSASSRVHHPRNDVFVWDDILPSKPKQAYNGMAGYGHPGPYVPPSRRWFPAQYFVGTGT